jgi:large subunit ribosomal protein L31e
MEERILTFNLTKLLKKKCRIKRVPYLLRLLREKVKRITKVENVEISTEFNQRVWRRGIKKVPRKMRVKVVKEGEKVRVEAV